MADELAERVLSAIASTKRIPREQVSMESSLQDLGLDSLDQLNLLFALESEFNISISDEQARSIRTVREMVAGVRQLTGGVSGGAASQAS